MLPASAEPLIFQGLCYDKMGQQTKAEAAWRDAVRVGPRCLGATLTSGPGRWTTVIPRPASITSAKAIAKYPGHASWETSCIFNLAKRSS